MPNSLLFDLHPTNGNILKVYPFQPDGVEVVGMFFDPFSGLLYGLANWNSLGVGYANSLVAINQDGRLGVIGPSNRVILDGGCAYYFDETDKRTDKYFYLRHQSNLNLPGVPLEQGGSLLVGNLVTGALDFQNPIHDFLNLPKFSLHRRPVAMATKPSSPNQVFVLVRDTTSDKREIRKINAKTGTYQSIDIAATGFDYVAPLVGMDFASDGSLCVLSSINSRTAQLWKLQLNSAEDSIVSSSSIDVPLSGAVGRAISRSGTLGLAFYFNNNDGSVSLKGHVGLALPSDPVLTSLEIVPDSVSLPEGEQLQFRAFGTYDDDSRQDVTTAMHWSSGDSNLITVVNGQIATRGLATAISKGSALITVGQSPAFTIVASADVTITDPIPIIENFTIIPARSDNPTVDQGKTLKFTAQATLSDSSSQDISNQVNWNTVSFRKRNVATIDNTGLTTGISAGSATITAGLPSLGQSRSSQLTVVGAVVTLSQIVLSEINVAVQIGNSVSIFATAIFDDQSTSDITGSATWTTDDQVIATVQAGVVTGVSAGTVQITASRDGVTSLPSIVQVTVDAPAPVPGVLVPCPTGVSIKSGQKFFQESPQANGRFGSVVAVDGNKAAASSPENKVVNTFTFGFMADAWGPLEPAPLPSDTNLFAFGLGLAISGNTLVVSASSGISDGGKLFIFTSDDYTWTEVSTLSEPNRLLWGLEGQLAIVGDRIVVGSPADSNNKGVVYVYEKSGSGIFTSFNLIQTLTASDGQAEDAFGSSVAYDGTHVAVGAIFDNTTGVGVRDQGRGAVYIFDSQSKWAETKITTNDDPGDVGRKFGASLDFDGDTLVVGQPPSQAVQFSSVYVYTGSGSSWTLEERLEEKDLSLTGTTGTLTSIGAGVQLEDNELFVSFIPDVFDCSRVVHYQRAAGVWTLVDIFILDRITKDAGDNRARLSVSAGRFLAGMPFNRIIEASAGAVIYIKVSDFALTSIAAEPPASSSSRESIDAGLFKLTTEEKDSLEEEAGNLVAVCDAPYISAHSPYLDEYGFRVTGQWYYRQDKPGTAWFDRADNVKGWTIDFTLTVTGVENVSALADSAEPDGLGIYVNDGTFRETIYFLPQEVVFLEANRKVVFDATATTQYRLIGKEQSLQLFANSASDQRFKEIAKIHFNKSASSEGNGRKPATVQDSNGVDHVVWYDDGNQAGQMLYAKLDNGTWSEPELLVSTPAGLQNPDIGIGENGNIYVVYESNQTETTNIGFIYKNNVGWSSPQLIGTGTNHSRHPRLSVDGKGDAHVVWEDHRLGHPEIFYNKWSLENFSWSGETRVTEVEFGAYRPAIATYRETAFIAWVKKFTNETSSVHLSSYNTTSDTWVSSYHSGSDITVPEPMAQLADDPDVLITSAGKIYVVWQDNFTDQFEIYNRIFALDLTPLTDVQRITDACNDSLYPRLSEHEETGDVYIAWEDYRELDPRSVDPYCDPYLIPQRPHIFIALHENLNDVWRSSANNSFDVMLDALDNRRWSSPAVSDTFSGNLHVLYDGLFAADEYLAGSDEYVTTPAVFHNVKDARYDLSRTEAYFVSADVYGETDLLVSGRLLRKEIRFGDFSDTLSCDFMFGSIRYYLEDAVDPFEIVPVSSVEYPVSNFSVNDAVVNNHGDAWLATGCGVIFYFANTGNITVLPDNNVADKNIKTIAFDRNNVMFVAVEVADEADDIILASSDHKSFRAVTLSNKGDLTNLSVTTFAFDKNNKILIGTEDSGTILGEIFAGSSDSDDSTPPPGETKIIIIGIIPPPGDKKKKEDRGGNEIDDPPDRQLNTSQGEIIVVPGGDIFIASVTSTQVDDANVAWIGTTGGLTRFANNAITHFTTKNGLPSNCINGIAVRNTAIRYLATGSGVVKMLGSNFTKVNTQDADIWRNNVKSIAWQGPNIFWASTLSQLNQISNDSFTAKSYGVKDYTNFETNLDDTTTYFILSEDEFSPDSFTEVYLNGTRVKHGYDVLLKTSANASQVPFSLIKFKTELKKSDRVDVRIRNDIREIASFAQTDEEAKVLGSNTILVKGVSSNDDQIIIVSSGDENEIKVNETNRPFPYERIYLDTTPPVGEIKIVQQVDATTLRVNINNADDGTEGSGLDKMVISNFTNFTADGLASQTPIDFAVTSLHNMGSTVDAMSDSLVFSSGSGSTVSFIDSDSQLYAGTANPGLLQAFSSTDDEWITLVDYGDERIVEFVVKYNNKFVVGVGTSGAGAAQIFVYNDSTFTDPSAFAVNGARAFAAVELDNFLYVGTGPNGSLYKFDGRDLDLVLSGIGSNIYDLAAASGNLYAATGEKGHVYIIDPLEPSAPIVHSDSDDAITAINIFNFNGNKIFVGTSTEGKILRSELTNIAFNRSFKTISGRVSAIKMFNNVLYAAVGKTVYFFSATGSWVWRYTHPENINDFALDSFNDNIYVVSDSKVTRIKPITDEKTVYLKLIDKAGNETILFDTDGNVIPEFTDSITISQLQDFVNQSKIIELDPLGNIVDSLSGESAFFSGDKIEQDKGVYESLVFNGTNDLIKWDTISWQATEPSNTEVLIFVRASATQNDIILEDYQGPFAIEQAGGVDISSLSGQFIQFKAELTSKTKDISPSLHRVTVKSVTSQAVHFFTTNFMLGSKLTKGILTSQKLIPVAADIIFGVNTTDSIDWTDYHVIDENRIFNVDQIGKNMRVGIRFITPARSGLQQAAEFDEYGPYNTNLFINTVDFLFNNTGSTANYHFKISLYNDVGLTDLAFSASSVDDTLGFSVDGETFPVTGKLISSNGSVRVLFTVPGAANIRCNIFYFVKIESFDGTVLATVLDTNSFIAGCSASFIDNTDFEFTNALGATKNFDFRIRFYEDAERTSLFKTVFSGNDQTGWLVNNVMMGQEGVQLSKGESVNVLFRAVLTDFEPNRLYYLVIDAFDGSSFILQSNSFTFIARDMSSLIYCGAYTDVPVVKNFGLMFELENKEFLTLNL